MTLRLGVLPTNGRDSVEQTIDTISSQVDHLLIYECGTNIKPRDYPEHATVMTDDTGIMNVSRWWNKGLDWAQAVATAKGEETWDVAILNDDVVLPPLWFCYVADDMRALGCVASCSGGRGTAPVIHRAPGPVDLLTRLQGFAFVVAGESGLRAEEQMRWYYSDDWLDWKARQLGGMVIFPGCHVAHKYPNQQVTHEIQVYNTEDAEKFKRHWGMMPW